MLPPLGDCRLYTFVDTAYLGDRSPVEVTQQLCDGGADLIQLRAKDWSAAEVEATTAKILPITTRAGVWLVVNDHLSIAQQCGAPLCHLGQEDFFDKGYRHVNDLIEPGGETGIGMSTHAPAQAERSIKAGASYIAIGPVYATGTKPTTPPVQLDYVRWAKAHADHVPWFAIGGISLENLEEVLAAGAHRVAVVSAILKAPDIVKACEAFKNRLT